MTTLSIRDLVRNAAAVFAGRYGAVNERAQEVGCSRQAVYNHARQVEQRLQPPAEPIPPTEVSPASPVEPPAPPLTATLDQPTRERFAVVAFAMGLSTRQIEDLLALLTPDGPDHSTIGRWVAAAAAKAKPVLQALDAACVPQVQTLAVDEIFFGGGRLWWASNRRA